MIFGKVDVPRELVRARESGNLAVFAGAGVSVGHPSNLPGFEELVSQVAEGTNEHRSGNEDFDRFLGRLHRKGEGVDVHRIVRRKLTEVNSAPTPLHYELLKLFDRPSDVRIVTTNFDRHFEAAAGDMFDQNVSCFEAPALPQGDDFAGVVHLHGSVMQKPGRLVLTDEDFSRAYLTRGWARRFLQQVFAEYHVLFVGYSHGDTVVSYLARGIPATDDEGRYALDKAWTEEDEKRTDWAHLGVELISFPQAEGGSAYAELPRAKALEPVRATNSPRARNIHARTGAKGTAEIELEGRETGN